MLLHNDNRSGRIQTVCPRVAAAMKQTRDTAGIAFNAYMKTHGLTLPRIAGRRVNEQTHSNLLRSGRSQNWESISSGSFSADLCRKREDIITIAPKKDDSVDATKVRVSLQRQQAKSFIYFGFHLVSRTQVGSEQDGRPVHVPKPSKSPYAADPTVDNTVSPMR